MRASNADVPHKQLQQAMHPSGRQRQALALCSNVAAGSQSLPFCQAAPRAFQMLTDNLNSPALSSQPCVPGVCLHCLPVQGSGLVQLPHAQHGLGAPSITSYKGWIYLGAAGTVLGCQAVLL